MTEGETIGLFEVPFAMSRMQRSIMQNVASFYTKDTIETVLLPLLTQSGPVSLRSVDWCLTNWSKRTNVACQKKDGEMFLVHEGYRKALRIWKRKLFDPFRRRQRIFITSHARRATTIGQINFFHWAYTHGILDLCCSCKVEIQKDMDKATERHKRAARSMKKRVELTKAPGTRCIVYRGETTIRIC